MKVAGSYQLSVASEFVRDLLTFSTPSRALKKEPALKARLKKFLNL
jgi:hypothetical protein